MAKSAAVDHKDGAEAQKRTLPEADDVSRPPLPRRQPNPEEGIAAAGRRVNGGSPPAGSGRLAGDGRRAARHARHALRAEAEDQIPILRSPIPSVRESAPKPTPREGVLPPAGRFRGGRPPVATDHPSLSSVIGRRPAAVEPAPPAVESIPIPSAIESTRARRSDDVVTPDLPSTPQEIVGRPDDTDPRPLGAGEGRTTFDSDWKLIDDPEPVRASPFLETNRVHTPPAPPETSTTDEDPMTSEKVNLPMSNYHDATNKALGIEGALGFAIVDSKSGMAMAVGGDPGFDLSIAAAGNSSVVQAKLRTINELELNESIEDVLITLSKQFHIIRVTEADPSVFLYLVLSRARANLAMARYQLTKIEGQLRL